MSFESFIIRKFSGVNKTSFSYPVIRLAILSIALSTAVMLISVSVVTGFKKEIGEKVSGFGSHILLTNYELTQTIGSAPIEADLFLLNQLRQTASIKNVSMFAYKAGIIKNKSKIQGFIFKGIGRGSNNEFFQKNMISGRLPVLDSLHAQEVIISQNIARKIDAKTGDKLRCYFIADEQIRAKAFVISGIFHTGLEAFDDKFIIGNISQVQKLNNWKPYQADGYEILTDNLDDIQDVKSRITPLIPFDLKITTIDQKYPEIFDWLELTNMNVWVILAIMAAVCIMTIVSVLLITILEKTNAIGLFKTMGASNLSLTRIFVSKSLILAFKGILVGNVLALTISILQLKFGILKLDQESYYMPVVPINLDWLAYFLINGSIVLLCVFAMLIPSMIINRISPAKSVRFN